MIPIGVALEKYIYLYIVSAELKHTKMGHLFYDLSRRGWA